MRRAFTLIELLVVIGIMTTLGALTVPGLLRVAQRARIADAAGRVEQVWGQARFLAMQEQPATSEDANGNGTLDPGEDRNGNGVLDTTTRPWHYGIVLVQPDSGTPWVGLIYDNRALAAIQADPAAGLLQRGGGAPVLRYDLPGGVRIATAAAFGGTAAVAPTVLAVYVQFGTGCPISPAAVAAGAGGSAGLVSLGTRTSPASGYPGTVRLSDPSGRDPGVGISIHEAGVCASQVE